MKTLGTWVGIFLLVLGGASATSVLVLMVRGALRKKVDSDYVVGLAVVTIFLLALAGTLFEHS